MPQQFQHPQQPQQFQNNMPQQQPQDVAIKNINEEWNKQLEQKYNIQPKMNNGLIQNIQYQPFVANHPNPLYPQNQQYNPNMNNPQNQQYNPNMNNSQNPPYNPNMNNQQYNPNTFNQNFQAPMPRMNV